MNWNSETTKEGFLKFVESKFYIRVEKLNLVKIEDDESILFQIVSDGSFQAKWILELGILHHNPNLLATNEGKLLITFIIQK